MVEKGWKYDFLVIVLGKTKYGTDIGNPTLQWTSPEDPCGYDKSIQPKDSSFDKCKSKKKHGCKDIEYEKFLGVEKNI